MLSTNGNGEKSCVSLWGAARCADAAADAVLAEHIERGGDDGGRGAAGADDDWDAGVHAADVDKIDR